MAEGVEIDPIVTGGTGSMSESIMQPHFMPDMLHSGTMNTPAVISLGVGAKIALGNMHYTLNHERELAKRFMEDLMCMDGVTVYAPYGEKKNGTVSFNVNGCDPSELEEYLDKKNIVVRAGYHCAPLAHRVLGSGKTGSVRASFGFFNTEKDRTDAVDAIYRFVKNKNK